MLNSYCKLFELDWRGDVSLENREQFLMQNPIYIHSKDQANLVEKGEISNSNVLTQIRQACQPFLPDLLTKLRKLSSKK